MAVHLVVRAGLEPASFRFQVWRSNHSTISLRSLSSTDRHLSLVMLTNWEEFKMSLGRGGGVNTGIVYSSQFRSHQETKVAVRPTQRSTFTISRT